VSFCPEQGNGFLNRKQRLDEYMGYKTLEEMPDDMRDYALSTSKNVLQINIDMNV
jgi:hypothetical protein